MYGGGELGNGRDRLVGEMTWDMTRDRYIAMYVTRQSHCYVHDISTGTLLCGPQATAERV